jgi:hypothetical protein
MTMNHWPIFGRTVPPHGAAQDTADPHTPITCPVCRNMLANKVAAHQDEAKRSRSVQQRQFFAADAAHWQAVLDR